MRRTGRRRFIKNVGLGIGILSAGTTPESLSASTGEGVQSPEKQKLPQPNSKQRPLYNINLQTAIGLGDERASVVDGFGQIKSRNAWAYYEIGKPWKKVDALQSAQRLEEGYLPVVHTAVQSQNTELNSVAFASDFGGLKADYWGLDLNQPCLPFANALLG